MTPLLSLILIVLIAYVGSVFFQKSHAIPFVFKGISHSGLLYLLLGLFIGPNFLKILDNKILDEISIILAFVLGWTGFLIGLQINIKQLLRFRFSYYWMVLGNFILIFALLFSGMLFLNYQFNNFFNLFEILILATAGSISSPILMGVLKKDFKIRGKPIHFLQFHSAYDNIIGVLIIGLFATGGNYIQNESMFLNAANLFFSIIIVVILAIIFYFMVNSIKNVQQYFLILIGFILFLVGTALHFNSSALFLPFVFGFILTNLPINTWKLFHAIANAEKPIYLLLLIFMGASLPGLDIFVLLLALVFVIWRICCKYIAGRIVIFGYSKDKQLSQTVGLAGIGMGGLTLALGIDYHISSVAIRGEFILLILAMSYLINDTFSVALLKPIIKSKNIE